MALHGEVKINGQAILVWSAVRQEALDDPGQRSTYQCEVLDVDKRLGRCFTVTHTFSDGAAVLLSIIMRRYNYLKNGVPLDGQEPA